MQENDPRHISDEQLLAQYGATKDNRWLGILLQRYTLLLVGVGMKYLKNKDDAADCVQQVFLKVLAYVPQHEVTHFRSWIYTITKNQALMILRHRKGVTVDELEEAHTESLSDNSENEVWEREQLMAALENSMGKLNAEQESCIRLFYLEKLSYSQIAEKKGYTAAQIKSHIQNGKRNLKSLILKKSNQ